MNIENNVFNNTNPEADFFYNKNEKGNTHLLKSNTFSIREIVKKIFSLLNIFSTTEIEKKSIKNLNIVQIRDDIQKRTKKLLDGQINSGLSDLNIQNEREKIESIKRDFFHKNLDGTPIKSADLEGTTLLVSLHSTLADLQEFIDHCQEPEKKALFQKLHADLKKAYPLTVEIDLIQRLNNEGYETKELKDEFCKKLSLQLQDLKIGERLLIPGGIEGHAMCYEFECIRDRMGQRKMNLKIINSGQGSENHLSEGWFSLFATRRQTYQVINIDPTAVENETFLFQVFNEIFESRDSSSFSPLALFREIFNGDKIYKLVKTRILKTGKGEFVTTKTEQLTHKEQKQGTCAKKIFTYWLKENLSEKMRREFKQHYTKKSIEKLKEIAQLEEKMQQRIQGLRDLTDIERSHVEALKNDVALTSELLEAGQAVLDKRTQKARS